jgi:sigma-B regulation protein RsbU (phosphoserine phosphatase)
VAASLLMSNLQAAVRLTMLGEADPGVLLGRWNRLTHENTEASKFVTCLAGILDPAARRLTLANAGHHLPYVVGPAPSDCFEVKCEPSYPLGVADDAEYATASIDLAAEPCTLFCYTDGVVEAMNTDGGQFGRARMLETLHAAIGAPPAEIISRMREAIITFCNEATQSDDITMLALRLA